MALPDLEMATLPSNISGARAVCSVLRNGMYPNENSVKFVVVFARLVHCRESIGLTNISMAKF